MPSDNVGVISMNDFLDFLKITCQVNESIDSKNSNKNSVPIDYNQLAKNDLVNTLLTKNVNNTIKLNESNVDDSKKQLSPQKEKNNKGRRKSLTNNRSQKKSDQLSDSRGAGFLDPALSDKLNEVINEGILDSVLPFLCPMNSNSSQTLNIQNLTKNLKSPTIQNQQLITTKIQPQQVFDFQIPDANTESTSSSSNKRSPTETTVNNNLALPQNRGDRLRRKSVSPLTNDNHNRLDTDVVIHVCDEVKNSSRDFMCPQKLLVSKMGYFADVTSGSRQRLEDMDISVHCDLQIFEWLMKWVKKDSLEEIPSLDPTNVVPILVSASFLQMEPLLLDCLSFCHARLNDVVKTSANLSCFNDVLITRLAAMFTNIELEAVKDKKDRVAPRLWTKLIQSLCEPEAQSLRGHYSSLAGLYRCNRCGKYLTQSVSPYIYCLPQNIRINRWGQLVSQHSRDTGWSITNYVAALYKDLRSWRKVYWRLWGHCHFLYCSVCEMHFPTYQMNWCQYHPDQPQFLGPITEGRPAGPGGRFPCCGQQAYRYETLPGPTGCQYREHTVQIQNDKDRAILQLVEVAGEGGGCLFEAPPSKSTTNGNNEPWWSGLSVLPHRSRQGLLPTLHIDESCVKGNKKHNHRQNSVLLDSSSDSRDSSDNNLSTIQRRYYSSSSDGEESEHETPKRFKSRPTVKRKVKMACGRYWSGEMSARSNQDNQREFEERAMKQIIAMVGKRTGSDVSVQYQSYQQGGSYFKLESEWRENLRRNTSNKTKK